MSKPIRIWYQSYVDDAHGRTYLRRLKAHIDGIVDAGTTVDIHGITPHDNYAHSIVEFRCAREVICNAVRAEREGYDAFVIGHMQDAGLYEARAVVDIPVIALGEASMLHACQLGQRIGIVTISERYIPWFRQQIRKYGLEHRVTGVDALPQDPASMLAAFDDAALAKVVSEQFASLAEPLVRDGIEVLIPGGGLAMVLFSSIQGHAVRGAPVINGIPIIVKAAEAQVKLRRLTGLAASRAGEFAKPPPEIIDEFMAHPKGL